MNFAEQTSGARVAQGCVAGMRAADARAAGARVAQGCALDTQVADSQTLGVRVALGMSGGVDSSVAAALLRDAGFEVVGITCIFASGKASDNAIADARAVAHQLGIAHVVRDCANLFERGVVAPFVASYACGRTPSPCVGCNATCKFPSLLAAADELGCEFVATGHYARVVRVGAEGADARAGRVGEGADVEAGAEGAGTGAGAEGAGEQAGGTRFAIARAAYAPKDQSYMLGMLSQAQLARIMLPLGSIEGGKPAVRRIAQERGLPVAHKGESQDICFIEGSHEDFLVQRGVTGSPGAIVDRTGRVLGHHDGLFRYTLGQRKGLRIGGAPEPYYVVGADVARNELIVGFARDAYMVRAKVTNMNWQAIFGVPNEGAPESQPGRGSFACEVKLRYRQAPVACWVHVGEGGVVVELEKPAPLTAPGQFAVLYRDGVILGAGEIESVS